MNRHLAAIRRFWWWLVREELAVRNPADYVTVLKVPHRLPSHLSIPERERLLEVLARPLPPHIKQQFPSSRKWTRTWRRDHALIATTLLCGLRVEELSTLRVADVDLDSGVLRVIGKGNKQRECVVIPGSP